MSLVAASLMFPSHSRRASRRYSWSRSWWDSGSKLESITSKVSVSFSIVELGSGGEMTVTPEATDDHGGRVPGTDPEELWAEASWKRGDLIVRPQLQRMEKLSFPAQDERPSQSSSPFSSSSFVNTHLSLTKVVRHHLPVSSFEGVNNRILFSLRVGRVPPSCFSPRIQQAEADRSLGFFFDSNLCGDIRSLFAHPSHSRRRILGTAATAR